MQLRGCACMSGRREEKGRGGEHRLQAPVCLVGGRKVRRGGGALQGPVRQLLLLLLLLQSMHLLRLLLQLHSVGGADSYDEVAAQQRRLQPAHTRALQLEAARVCARGP